MKKLFVLIILISLRSYSQNLVPNPGFELSNACMDTIACPIYNPHVGPCYCSCCGAFMTEIVDQKNSAPYNWSPVHRYPVNGNENYYFNKCIVDLFEIRLKKQNDTITVNKDWYTPRTGEAFIVLFTFGDRYTDSARDIRGYAQVRLKQPLKAGFIYKASCFVLLTTNLDYDCGYFGTESQASDGLGMYFSKDSVFFTDNTMPYKALTQCVPQVSNPRGNLLMDSVNYQEISGLFTASGGEEWLVLGNFKNNANTMTSFNDVTADWGTRRMNSMYSIDDVSVTEWKPDLVAFTDTSLCVDSSLTIILPEGLKNYKWSTGEMSRQISLASSGQYTVEASSGSIILRDTFYIHTLPPFTAPFTLGADIFFCKIPASYQLHAPSSFDLYEWSTGSHASSIAIPNAGKYWVSASYACGTLKDTIVVTEFVKPDFILIPVNDTAICSNSSIDLQIADASMYSHFVWNNGSVENHLMVNQADQYSVQAYTAENCEVRDTIHITTIIPPLLSLHGDTLFCEGSELKLVVPVKISEKIIWNDGSVDSSYRIHTSGVYWARLSNTCFNTTDSIAVTFVDCAVNVPNLITVNGDGKNDYFLIQTEVGRKFELSIYNSWGSQIYHDAAYKNNWNAEDLDSGIYFYYINDSLLNKHYKGWLQVIK